MFTGIITDLGKCVERSDKGLRLECSKDFAQRLAEGASVSVNGACLTVSSLDGSIFSTDVMPETWRRTTLGSLKAGDAVNLEAALRADGRLDGHIVQGHVDGTGRVLECRVKGNSHIFVIEAAPELLAGIVEKGSVAVNGVSLTLIEVTDKTFSVGIIPYTFDHTTFGHMAIGAPVNIETDVLAKYFLKFTKGQNGKQH